jgi:hypothetical protein
MYRFDRRFWEACGEIGPGNRSPSTGGVTGCFVVCTLAASQRRYYRKESAGSLIRPRSSPGRALFSLILPDAAFQLLEVWGHQRSAAEAMQCGEAPYQGADSEFWR